MPSIESSGLHGDPLDFGVVVDQSGRTACFTPHVLYRGQTSFQQGPLSRTKRKYGGLGGRAPGLGVGRKSNFSFSEL